MLISRIFISDILSVLGIGVAERVKTSTFSFIFLICSFALTPKRCSSSRINRPKSWNLTSLDNNLWVPHITFNLLDAKSSKIFFCSLVDLNLFNISTVTPKSEVLDLAVI